MKKLLLVSICVLSLALVGSAATTMQDKKAPVKKDAPAVVKKDAAEVKKDAAEVKKDAAEVKKDAAVVKKDAKKKMVAKKGVKKDVTPAAPAKK
jgi:hypothetical protein